MKSAMAMAQPFIRIRHSAEEASSALHAVAQQIDDYRKDRRNEPFEDCWARRYADFVQRGAGVHRE